MKTSSAWPLRGAIVFVFLISVGIASGQVPKISGFKADPAMTYAGKVVTLSWVVSGATSLSISGIGPVSGSFTTVKPGATTTYVLTASNASGSAQASTRVLIKPAQAIFPNSSIARASGGGKTVSVRSSGAWTAVSNVAWVTVTAGQSGSGNGFVTLAVAPNSGPSPRSGTLKIRGQIYTVHQDGQSALVHPRLSFNPTDIASMQAWAVPENTAYLVLSDIVAQAKQAYDTRWGTPNWKDNGTYMFSPETTEDYAVLFAFMSQLATDPVKKADYANRAKNMMMFVINQAALGPSDGVPFRDPHFGIKDRARFYGQTFPLITDYIYPYLSANEKLTIRNVMLQWCWDSKNAYVGNGNALMGLRGSANNYQLSHFRNVVMRSEVMDPVDDPVQNPNYPATALGNTLHSFTSYASGRWLQDLWTLFDHGDGRDGLPIEGTLYGLSYGWFHDGLRTLHNTSLDDPQAGMPQLAMVQSPFWDSWCMGFLHLMANSPYIPASSPWVGSVYEQFAYCDLLRTWNIPENSPMLASVILYDRSIGNKAASDETYWVLRNATEGAHFWTTRVPGRSWFGNPPGFDATMQFAARDPFATPPADPRPSLPRVFESGGVGMVIGRTNWTPTASAFAFRAAYVTENHATADAGSFYLYRKGEMLTSPLRGYTGQDIMNTTDYANTLGIQNDTPSDLYWFESQGASRGSQWIWGVATGDPKLTTSTGTGYIAAEADLTKLYNRVTNKSSVTDVQLATRTAIWLQPDIVVIYDRARTGKSNRFKRFNLLLPSNPVVAGHVATATTTSGQQLFVTSLLPLAGTLTPMAQESDGKAEGESMTSRLVIEDPAKPADVRFLHVLQGADAGVVRTKPTLLNSTAGMAFEGATVKSFVALFPHVPIGPGTFTSLTYVVKAGIATHFIAGLEPNMTYNVTKTAVATGVQFTITAGSQLMTDKTGVLTFKTSQIVP